MSSPKKEFVSQLLAADPPSPTDRERYEKEVRAMFEKQIPLAERKKYLIVGIIFTLVALVMLLVPLSITLSEVQKWQGISFILAWMVATSLALFATSVLAFRTWHTGMLGLGASRGWSAIGVGYVALVGWLFLLLAQYVPEPVNNDVRVFGGVLLLYAAVAWVRHSIARAEMATAVRLLQVELSLADLREAIRAKTT